MIILDHLDQYYSDNSLAIDHNTNPVAALLFETNTGTVSDMSC